MPDDYLLQEGWARELEAYLRKTLAPTDYAGIVIAHAGESSPVHFEVTIYEMDGKAVDAALAAYSGHPFPLTREAGVMSLAQAEQFIRRVEEIPHTKEDWIFAKDFWEAPRPESGKEHLYPSVEPSGEVRFYIYKEHPEALMEEIQRIAQELKMPKNSWDIELIPIYDPSTDNPLT